MSKPHADQFGRRSLQDLQRMYADGRIAPTGGTNPFPGVCYGCMKPNLAAGTGHIWALKTSPGQNPGGRLLCTSCDVRVRTPVAEGDGE